MQKKQFSGWQLGFLVALRLVIGWHFLYEGVIKLYNPDWTSFGYLATAQGPLEPLFLAIAKASPTRRGLSEFKSLFSICLFKASLGSGLQAREAAMQPIDPMPSVEVNKSSAALWSSGISYWPK